MALIASRPFRDSLLDIEGGQAHIFEPEFHQDVYKLPAEEAQKSPEGAFQLGDPSIVVRAPNRGKQPTYSDDLDDPDTLRFAGRLMPDGSRLTTAETSHVAALKSVSVRQGYVDLDSARSVSAEFYESSKSRSGVVRGDLLINSTGDGTIGRVAVYHYDYPAVVDGHITIVRFHDPSMAWYAAAYLQTRPGQHQLYRYINGSSGQVEIYPQDISRVWVPKKSTTDMALVGTSLSEACDAFESFRNRMGSLLALASA